MSVYSVPNIELCTATLPLTSEDEVEMILIILRLHRLLWEGDDLWIQSWSVGVRIDWQLPHSWVLSSTQGKSPENDCVCIFILGRLLHIVIKLTSPSYMHHPWSILIGWNQPITRKLASDWYIVVKLLCHLSDLNWAWLLISSSIFIIFN